MKILNKIAKRIIAKEGYTFNELNKDIQDKIIENNFEDVQDLFNEDFQENISYKIDKMFPNSNIKYTYSLGYSQGDGFGLYGDIDIEDAIKLCGMTYTKLEIEILEQMICMGTITPIEIYNNSNETYFRKDMINMSDSFDVEEAEYLYEEKKYSLKNEKFNAETFCNKNKQLEKKLQNKLEEFCKKMEKDGYQYLYEDCEKDVKEQLMEDTETLYDENGNMI